MAISTNNTISTSNQIFVDTPEGKIPVVSIYVNITPGQLLSISVQKVGKFETDDASDIGREVYKQVIEALESAKEKGVPVEVAL
jgi:hypothetical protein